MSLTLTLMLEQTLSMDEEAPLLDPEDEYESAAPEVPDGVARPTGPDSPGS